MKKAVTILVFLILGLSAITSNAAIERVPVVGESTFTLGRFWVWDAVENGSTVYSTERYTVIKVNGSLITFEMASRFGGSGKFVPHHRLEVDIRKCLRRYENPKKEILWTLRLSYKDGNSWIPVDGLQTTLAFEEKFNCDPWIHENGHRQTLFTEHEGFGSVFQQRVSGDESASWFFTNGLNAGVAAWKKHPATPKATYEMKFNSLESWLNTTPPSSLVNR